MIDGRQIRAARAMRAQICSLIGEARSEDIETLRSPSATREASELQKPQGMQAMLAPAPLLPFDATGREPWAVPYALSDYVELVETLGRCLHPNAHCDFRHPC